MWGGSDAFLSQQLCRLVGPGSCWWNLRFMGWFLYSQSWIMDMKTPMFGNQKKVFFCFGDVFLLTMNSCRQPGYPNLVPTTWFNEGDLPECTNDPFMISTNDPTRQSSWSILRALRVLPYQTFPTHMGELGLDWELCRLIPKVVCLTFRLDGTSLN